MNRDMSKSIHTIVLYAAIVLLLGVSIVNLSKVGHLEAKVKSINSYIVKDTVNTNQIAILTAKIDSLTQINDSLSNIKQETKVVTKTVTVMDKNNLMYDKNTVNANKLFGLMTTKGTKVLYGTKIYTNLYNNASYAKQKYNKGVMQEGRIIFHFDSYKHTGDIPKNY